MDRDVTELPLIVFDDVDDEPKTSNLGQNENGASPIFASASEERVAQATVSVCGGSGGDQGCLEIDSTGKGEVPGSDKRMVEPGKDLDASGMEDMIQKILEKYGETEVQSGDAVMTPERTATTSQDVTERRGAAKREADGSVSDMIRRESSKWDRVYGTEDIHAPGPTRDWIGRQEIHGRRPVPATEDTFQDVAIGSVIRSQTGVARQLISVSAGLDGINDDLEDMKRELKRIQTKDYTCLDGANDLVGQTTKEFAPIGCLKNAGGTYRRKNEWVEERAGVVRFEDENSMQETERYLKTHQAPTSSYLPGAGRAHIKESDVNLTHLLTIAEPVEPYRQTRSVVDDGAVKRERYIDADRFGRSSTQFVSSAESSSKHGSHRKPDGYCNLCEEFDDISTKRRSLPTYEEPLRVPQKLQIHTYQSTPVYEDPYKVTLRSHNQTYQSTPTYGELSKVGYRPLHQTYQSTSSYEDPYKVTHKSYDHTYRSTPAYEDPYKVTYGSNNHTYQSTAAYEDPYKVTHRSHSQTYQSTPAYEEPSKLSQRSHNQTYQSISTYEEPSKVVYRSRNHTYDSPTITDVDQNSHHRSREDLGGIYKTPSGIYFYSDAIRNYSDQATLDPDGGNMRSFVRQTSVPPRGYQSHSSSFVRQSSVPPRGYQSHSSSPVAVASQSHRSSGEFTSRFLTKVRNRRNSLGGRIDTDSYGARTLKGY